jgi:hypothetical protein
MLASFPMAIVAVILAAVLLVIAFTSQTPGGTLGLTGPAPLSATLLWVAAAISALVLILAAAVIFDKQTSGGSKVAVIGSIAGIALAWVKLVGQALTNGS